MTVATRAVEPRSRRYDPAETRQRVLEAANLLFSTKGFAATGTADIARAADVSEGSIFYHFGSKNNLLIEIGRMYGERMIAVMQGDDALGDLDIGDAIRRCVTFCLETKDWENITGEACAEAKPRTPLRSEAEPFYHASREVTIDWSIRHIQAASAKRGYYAINVPVAAKLIYALVGEALDEIMSTNDPAERATIVDESVRFVRTACGLPPA